MGRNQPIKNWRLRSEEFTDLVEASARYNEWDTLKGSATTSIINFVHSESQNAGFAIQTLDKIGITRVGRKDLDIEVKMWLLRGDPSIIIGHCWLAMRNIYPRLNATRSVLGVRTDDLEAVTVDAPGEGVPEGVLDHARQTVHRVLSETSLIEDYSLPIVITS